MNEIERKLNAIIDQLDPTYINVRNIHQMVFDLNDEIKRIKNTQYSINDRLDSIEKKLK
jgi:septation ring formation regulator EzrA